MTRILFDTETTGLVKSRDLPLAVCPKIIELYAMEVDDEFNFIDELDILIDPKEMLTAEIVGITGITQDMVKGKGDIVAHWPQIREFMFNPRIESWTGHNVTFDNDMMFIEARRVAHKWEQKPLWCSVEFCETQYGRRKNLGDFYELVMGEPLEDAHRAKNDVVGLQKVLKKLAAKGVDLELPGVSLGNILKQMR